MKAEVGINFHNRFDIEIRDAETGKLKQQGFAENIILDQMYNRICNFSTYFVNIHFGTGTGILDPTRTTLFSHLGTKAAATEEIVKAYPISKWVRKITINPEEYVGQTFTEVGVAYGSTSSYLVTHAMIKDSEGNPLTLTKTDLDVLVIYATVFIELQHASDNIYFTGLPDSNGLLNYLFGGSAPSSTLYMGPWNSKINDQAVITYLASSKGLTKTVQVSNKKVLYNTRIGITQANERIQELSLNGVFRCCIPESGVFDGFSVENHNLGIGDGQETVFSINQTDITNVTVKVDGALVYPSDYSLKNIGLAYGGTRIPMHALMEDDETPRPELINTPYTGIGYLHEYRSNVYAPTVKVDPNKIINKTIHYKFDAGSTSTTCYLYIQGSYNGTTWETIKSHGTKNEVTGSAVNTNPYNYFRAYVAAGSYHAYLYYIYFASNTPPCVEFLTPPGLVTGEAVGMGDGSTDIFTLVHAPLTDSLTVYLDGLETTDYTLNGNSITFTTAPAQDVMITADYRYSCTITADYNVSYIPKDENHVLDVAMELQFGEGV